MAKKRVCGAAATACPECVKTWVPVVVMWAVLKGRQAGEGAGNAKSLPKEALRYFLAERTGLEPATPGVTGRYSNQLNYRSNRKTVVGVDGVEPPTFCL